MTQQVDFTHDIKGTLSEKMRLIPHDLTFVLTDSNTHRLCWPLVEGLDELSKAQIITIPAGDEHKDLESLTIVWKALQTGGATRHSLLINLGGGMVTDLGGFAASTFKRGIRFINIPTTLLAMVDASVGGKTGINFGGLKNEIGVFRDADQVIIDTHFLQTLDRDNILSGYAEMLKHALLSTTAEWAELLNYNILEPDLDQLSQLLTKNLKVKERIVREDPTEQGLRKALNLGHTIGHALESFAMEQDHPILHGYAVAWGLVCELWLSAVKLGFPTDKMRQTVSFVRQHYGTPALECKHYDQLLALMAHDKKNIGDTINFTLLADIGDIRRNQTATHDEISEALDFLREG